MGFEYAKHPMNGEDLKGFRAHEFGTGLNGYAHFAIPLDEPAKQKSLKRALDTITAHYERKLRDALDNAGLKHRSLEHLDLFTTAITNLKSAEGSNPFSIVRVETSTSGKLIYSTEKEGTAVRNLVQAHFDELRGKIAEALKAHVAKSHPDALKNGL